MAEEPITTDSPTPGPEPSTAEPRDRKRRSYVRHGYHALKRRVKVAGGDARSAWAAAATAPGKRLATIRGAAVASGGALRTKSLALRIAGIAPEGGG